jgi:hypothetical protein
MIAPPKSSSHDELEALIKEARARRLHRRLLGAAGIAVAAALALGVYAVTSSSSGSSISGGSRNPSAGASPCRSSQLAAQADFNHTGGTPSIFGGVMIYNMGHSNCSLPHQRPIVLMSSSRGRVPIREYAFEHELVNQLGGPVPLMARGAFAEVYLLWSNWCAKPASALTLRLGDGAQVVAHMHTQPSCTHPGYRSRLVVSRTLTRR